MGVIAFQITSLNHLFGRKSKKTSKLRVTGLFAGNHRGPVNSPHKWPVTRKMFPFDDVIMTYHKRHHDFLCFCSYWRSVGQFNTKMPSYQQKDSHVYKTVSWPSYLHFGNPILVRQHFYIESGPKIRHRWPNSIIRLDHLSLYSSVFLPKYLVKEFRLQTW